MSKLHYILPMGGGGTRFFNNGFDMPKPLIELCGKPFFYWAAMSVLNFYDVADLTAVILKEHADKYNLDKEILKYFKDANIVYLDHVLNGAVLTCLEGIKSITDDGPILFNDCDHAFKLNSSGRILPPEENGDEAALLTFTSDNPAYSYVYMDESGRVTGTVEKEVVSNQAICGAYYFKNKLQFETAADTYLKNCAYKEFFLSGVYNELSKSNTDIRTYVLEKHIPFGTPSEYDQAKKLEDEFKLFIPDSGDNSTI